MISSAAVLRMTAPAFAFAMLAACPADSEQGGPAAADRAQAVAPRRAADMIHAALASDRAVYSREVVNRLTQVQKVQIVRADRDGSAAAATEPLQAREDWKNEHGKLPLPAQMFRMGAEETLVGDSGLSYLLLSPWPINRQNVPRTEVEHRALAEVAQTKKAVYDTEILDGKSYFVAMYPDVATVPACVACHNAHPDSPRRDFAVGDVMGGMVIRFPL